MAFKSIIPPSTTRPVTESKRVPKGKALQTVFAANFEFTTILLIGGLVQGFLLLLIPRFWMLLPTFIILASRSARTIAITLKLIPNPQMKGALHFRNTAVIPDRDGEFNKENEGAKEQVAVLLLGLRLNHPLGYFSPGMKALGKLNQKMNAALEAEVVENGYLGGTTWTNKTPEGSTDVLLISYWRSIEDIIKFSVGPSHRETWAWWEKNAADLKHIGISHEIFQAPRSMYESVYINFQPTRLGATSYLRKGDQNIGGVVPDQWISPLVDASRGKLRNSHGRLGWSTEEERDLLTEKMGYQV